MTLQVLIGATDVSAKLKRVETWRRSVDVMGRFEITLDNSNGVYLGAFPADAQVQIIAEGQPYLYGYIDVVTPVAIEDTVSHHGQEIQVNGRCFAQDLANKIYDYVYYPRPADDIVADFIANSGTEVTFTSPHSAPEIYYDMKGQYDLPALREVCQVTNRDAFVDHTKALQMFEVGTRDSGIVLKMVAGDSTSNIIEVIEHVEKDSLEAWNYIIVYGDTIDDSWTEDNASDWIGSTGDTVADFHGDGTTNPKAGVSAIKIVRGAGAAQILTLRLTFPRFNHTVLDFGKLKSPEIVFQFFEYDSYVTNPINVPLLRLKDAAGHIIEYRQSRGGYGEFAQTWYQMVFSANVDQKNIAQYDPANPFYPKDKWYFPAGGGTTFDWNNVVELAIETTALKDPGEYLIIDDLKLPIQISAVAQNAESQGLLKVRKYPIPRPDITTQREMQQYTNSILEKRKDVTDRVRIKAKGITGLIGGAWMWLPGYAIKINAPAEGFSDAWYRMLDIHTVFSDEPGSTGWNHEVELSLVPRYAKIDADRWSYQQSGDVALLRRLREKLQWLYQKEIEVRDWYPGLPKPLWELYGKIPHPGLDIDPYGSNLIANSSFEFDYDGDGVPDKWIWGQQNGAGATKAYIADAYEGAHAVKTTLLAGNVTLQTASWYSDFMAILPGTKYFMALALKGTGGTANVRVVWFAADKVTVKSISDAWSGAPTGSYVRRTGQVTSPADAYFAKFECYFGNVSASQVECQFDAAMFAEVLYSPHEIDKIIDNDKIIDDASINPSKIRLSPTNTLDHWQRGEDGSYFDGERVYMNSIAAAKLGGTIGVRGVPHALDKRAGETYSNPSLAGWGTWVCPVEIIYAGKSDARHRLHQVSADVKKYLSDPGTDTAQAYIQVRCSQNGVDYTAVYGPEEFTNTSYEEHLCTLSSDYVSASGAPLYIRIEVNIYRDVGDIGITQAWIKDPRINDRYQDGYRLELT